MNSLFSKSSIVELVLKNLLFDSFGSAEPQPINSETVRTILTACGELRLLEDRQLIDDMVLDLSGGDPDAVLDVESFSRALSNDILLYDVKKETSLSTYSDDVFGEKEMAINSLSQNMDDDNNNAQSQTEADPLNRGEGSGLSNNCTDCADDPENVVEEKNPTSMKKLFTCSQVDFLADGCRSKLHLILAYILFFFFIFRYQQNDYQPDGICDNSSMGCSIARNTIRWVVIMVVTM